MILRAFTAARLAGLALATLAAVSPREARAQAYTDPCIACDALYATDCSGFLWRIDTAVGQSWFLGPLPDAFVDLAVTADGRLVGTSGGGALYLVSACDASSTLLAGPSVGNGLTGDVASPDVLAQGPPLRRVETDGGGAWSDVGGAVGGAPPDWCGPSAGDLAFSPVDGLLRTALECGCVTGATTLQIVDPATAEVVRDAGCMRDDRGAALDAVYGLAYDSAGALWATQGYTRPRLLRLDADDQPAHIVAITGGYACGNGLACLPCGIPIDPCWAPASAPDDIGAALRVNRHGDPEAADITAWLEWTLDEGAPRPPGTHYHVLRGTDPRSLFFLTGPEPILPVTWQDSTPAATSRPLVHFYQVRAADACERVSLD